MLMKCSRSLSLLALLPICAFAATPFGLQLQAHECLDVRLYIKLLLWGPVVEELVFRAGLQKWLSQKIVSPNLANGVTSTVFALMHYALSGNLASLTVFVPSLVLGWVYQKTGSLARVIGLHTILNLTFMTFMCRS
jgi:membrane protease YdiL (CAAX protease family)